MATLQNEGEANEYKDLVVHHPAIQEFEGEAEYNFFHQPSAPIYDEEQMKEPLIGNENYAASAPSEEELYAEGMVDELKTIYTKLAIGSLFVTMLCAITLIAGILNGFYNWNGITFNAMVLFGGIIGISCGWYYDFSYNVKQSELHKKQIRKMKSLLIYFLICIAFTFIIFVIELVYFVLMPIRYEDEYSTPFMIGAMISFLFGILFWTVFVLFYIDLTARAVLKRGRIDFVIIRLKNDVNSSRIWMKIYFFVIWFRLKFRSLRKMLTRITGIHCFRGRMKMNAINPGKVHEEDRVIAMLDDDDGGYGHEDSKCCECDTRRCNERISNCGSSIVFVLCCPCVAMSSICEKVNFQYVFCSLLFGYVFAPIALLTLMVLVPWMPFLISKACEGNEGSVCGVFTFLVFPLWIWVWWWNICPGAGFIMGDNGFDWNAQCVMWNWTTVYFVEVVIEAFLDSSSK